MRTEAGHGCHQEMCQAAHPTNLASSPSCLFWLSCFSRPSVAAANHHLGASKETWSSSICCDCPCCGKHKQQHTVRLRIYCSAIICMTKVGGLALTTWSTAVFRFRMRCLQSAERPVERREVGSTEDNDELLWSWAGPRRA